MTVQEAADAIFNDPSLTLVQKRNRIDRLCYRAARDILRDRANRRFRQGPFLVRIPTVRGKVAGREATVELVVIVNRISNGNEIFADKVVIVNPVLWEAVRATDPVTGEQIGPVLGVTVLNIRRVFRDAIVRAVEVSVGA